MQRVRSESSAELSPPPTSCAGIAATDETVLLVSEALRDTTSESALFSSSAFRSSAARVRMRKWESFAEGPSLAIMSARTGTTASESPLFTSVCIR